uniref:Protein kinase domain-containing protein n=1 Tax=viral metagenome TaxID=1070528 RepID=A0A6C0C1X7_9ZZZZ
MSESTEETAHGTDATVLLKGAFASKIFHKRKNYDREIQAFQHLGNCKFVVPLISSEPSALTLVFPRYRTDLLRALTEGHTEVCAVACCRGLLAAIRHCHELNVVHRDVKLDNILLDDSSNPVLCDFSRSLMVTEPSAVHFEGTRLYAAPEALDAGICWKSNDIWSAAVVFYCLVEGLFPFSSTEEIAEDGEDTSTCIRRPRPNEVMPDLSFECSLWNNPFECKVRAMLQRMFVPSYLSRATVHEMSGVLSSEMVTPTKREK